MKTFSFVCIGLCAIASLKAQKFQLGHSVGMNYAESYGQYSNMSAASIVYSPGVFMHKSWGNWGMYMPFSLGRNLAEGRSTPRIIYTIPLYFEIGFNPGRPNLTVHGGIGYTTQLNDKSFSDRNGVIMSLHELHGGIQYKRFDSRVSVGTSPYYSRVTLGLYYYLRK